MRVFRMIATPVLLLALLGFLIWGASWGWKNLTAPLPSPSPTPCVTKSAATITPQMVTVRVFNGGFTTGLAGRVRDHLTEQGYQVARTGNTDERVAETIVRGNKDNEPMLKLVQSQFRGAVIQHDDRVDGSVDILVGTEYEGVADEPMAQIETEGGVTCEFVSPSPTPATSGSPAASEPAPLPSPTS